MNDTLACVQLIPNHEQTSPSPQFELFLQKLPFVDE